MYYLQIAQNEPNQISRAENDCKNTYSKPLTEASERPRNTQNRKHQGSKEQLIKGYHFSMPWMNNLGRESDHQAEKRKIFFLGAGPAAALLETQC